MDPERMNKHQAKIIGWLNGRPVYSVSGGHNVFSLDQTSFRGRNDDGSESGASWIDAANSDWTQDVDTNFRVRFLIQESGAGTASGTLNHASGFSSLQYNLGGAGWNSVTDSSSVVIMSASSDPFTNGDVTTQQLGSGTFVDGFILDSENITDSASFSGDDETEVEYCLQIVGADVSDTDTIQLRVVGEDGSGVVLNSYTNTPTITVNIPAGVTIDVPLGTFTINGQLPSVATGAAVDTPLGTFTLSGQLPSVVIDAAVNTPLGTFTLAGQLPDVLVDVAINAPLGSFTLSGQLPNVVVDRSINVSLGSFTLTELTPVVDIGVANVNVENPLGTFTLSPLVPTVPVDRSQNVSLGTFTLTGLVPSVVVDRSINVSLGTFTLTGLVPDVVIGVVNVDVDVSLGAFTLSGQLPAVAVDVAVTMPIGSFTLSPVAPSILLDVAVNAPSHAFTLTGVVPIVIDTGGAPGPVDVNKPIGLFRMVGK